MEKKEQSDSNVKTYSELGKNSEKLGEEEKSDLSLDNYQMIAMEEEEPS